MNIRIKIPERLLRAYDRFEDAVNVPVWTVFGFQIVRLDIALAALFVLCVWYYYATAGIYPAITGALMFIFVVMTIQWIIKR